ncbi:MAG: hypothetical protein AAF941_09465 [Pseudomonadota bacterium]
MNDNEENAERLLRILGDRECPDELVGAVAPPLTDLVAALDELTKVVSVVRQANPHFHYAEDFALAELVSRTDPADWRHNPFDWRSDPDAWLDGSLVDLAVNCASRVAYERRETA